MKQLSLKRRLQLYQQIYQFNHEPYSVCAFANIEIINKEIDSSYAWHYYYKTSDIWLRLISLPSRKLCRILNCTILSLLLRNISLVSNEKIVGVLRSFLTTQELNIGFQLSVLGSLEALNFKVEDPLIELQSFWLRQQYLLLYRLYSGKDIAFIERINNKFGQLKNETGDVDFEYWQGLSLPDLESLVLNSIQKNTPSILNLSVEEYHVRNGK